MNSGIRRVRRLLSLEKPSATALRPTPEEPTAPAEAPAASGAVTVS